MIVIIDGYNFIHAVPELERYLLSDLKSARQALIRECQRWFGARGDIQRFYIVFDGSSDVNFGADHYSGVEVIFSETGEEADDRIVDLLSTLPAGSATVVSNDNYVANNSRAYGAHIMSVGAFCGFADRKGAKQDQPRRDRQAKKRIPPGVAEEITKAYKKYLGID